MWWEVNPLAHRQWTVVCPVLIAMSISKADLLALRRTHSVIHLDPRVLLLWLRSRWTLPEIISFLSSFPFSILLHSHPGYTRN